MSKKVTKYILVEDDTKSGLETKVQSYIEEYEKYSGFLIKIDTIITPYNIYEYGKKYTDFKYSAAIHLTYNDI